MRLKELRKLAYSQIIRVVIQTQPVYSPQINKKYTEDMGLFRRSRKLWAKLYPPPQKVFVIVQSLSHVQLFNPWTACSALGLAVFHYLLEFAQTHVHWVGDAIQPSHSLPLPSPAFSLSQHQTFFQWVSSSHEMAKVLELQLQHQSFQWIFRTDFL